MQSSKPAGAVFAVGLSALWGWLLIVVFFPLNYLLLLLGVAIVGVVNRLEPSFVDFLFTKKGSKPRYVIPWLIQRYTTKTNLANYRVKIKTLIPVDTFYHS